MLMNKNLFKYHGTHNRPFDGLLGKSIEIKVINAWVGLDCDPKYWWTLKRLTSFINLDDDYKGYKEEDVKEVLDKLIHYKMIEKDGNYYSMNFDSGFWKGLMLFNENLIDVIIKQVREESNYVRKHIKRKNDGSYTMSCPRCGKIDMKDISWRCLPYGTEITLECKRCDLHCGCHVDIEHPPSTVSMPHKERMKIIISNPEFLKEHDEQYKKLFGDKI